MIRATKLLAVALVSACSRPASPPTATPPTATPPAEARASASADVEQLAKTPDLQKAKLEALAIEVGERVEKSNADPVIEAMADLAHFRPLCDKDGYPLVGNVAETKSYRAVPVAKFCAEVRKKEGH